MTTVKPGYFATPMTANLKLPKFLIRQPQVAAKDILYAMDNDKEVVFTPWFWKYVSVVVKIVPEFILNRI